MLKRAIVIAILVFVAMPYSAFAAPINIPTSSDIIIATQNLTKNIVGWFTGTMQARPYAVQYLSAVNAQIGGFGGAGGPLAMFFSEINGVEAPNASCPSGWTEALHGYGPHYLGLLSYYPIAANGNPMGFGPSQPPFPPPPLPPPTGGGGPSPGNPVTIGPITPGPGEPINEYNGGPVITPHGDDPLPPLPPGSNPRGVFLWPRIVPIALAQTIPPTYVLDDTAIGSDSTCSISSSAVAPFAVIYNGQVWPPVLRLYSDACFTDTTTSVTTCNRCRVCYK